LIAPQGHFYVLNTILTLQENSNAGLHGEGLWESVFFFVPRLIWSTKAPSSEYGTMLVQAWAGLPTTYQIAVTNLGELIAHFGYTGIFGLLIYGRIYGFLDSFAWKSIEVRVGLYCLVMPRVLVDLGMGLSSLSNTLVGLALFLVVARSLRLVSQPFHRQTKKRPINPAKAWTEERLQT
jgi:hypothetical protein